MRRFYIVILIIASTVSFSLPICEARQDGDSYSFLRLKGTLFTRSLKPIAIIEDTRSGQVTMYELNDAVDGAFEVVSISRGEVILKGAQGECVLSLPSGTILQPQLAARAESGKWYNIQRQGNTFLVDEATVASAVGRIREIMQNVRIKPSFLAGANSGITVTKLIPVGILAEAGVREGDVIRSVNGFGLNSPYQIFSAYKKLKDQRELKVDIIRDDKPAILTYKVR